MFTPLKVFPIKLNYIFIFRDLTLFNFLSGCVERVAVNSDENLVAMWRNFLLHLLSNDIRAP
jgi:hypothetical protein